MKVKKTASRVNGARPGAARKRVTPSAPVGAATTIVPRPPPGAAAAAVASQARPAGSFTVVGVGASAGGLEAFEEFFRNVPNPSGMAFVLIPHLDPSHVSILTEILQRTTSLPVVEARDQVHVEPDHVYVIPPNREMSIFNCILQVSEPKQPRGQRMPIDTFMRSLAEDQGERAVGIVLSGTGTDGTLGLRAILGSGGLSFVQDPSTAKYDGMPSSAIRAGHATFVLAVEKMPEVLMTGARSPEVVEEPATHAGALNRILMRLRTSTGYDFSQYKKSTISRRVERRMLRHDIADKGVYARFLGEDPGEAQTLIKELLINVTSFMRDPEAFATLKADILPQLLLGKPEGYVFRVWVAGCSTGEEAYSIAIVLRDYMEESHRQFRIQIYATDLDEEAIAVARAGCYPSNIVQDLPPETLRQYFVKEDHEYRVKKEIRELVVFALHNVLKDPPFTKLDLVSCRNLMIYLEPEPQARMIPSFHFALRPGGVLFLSPSESIGNLTQLFTPLSRKWKFYQANHSSSARSSVAIGGVSWSAGPAGREDSRPAAARREVNFSELTRRALLQSYAPASVVTDVDGNILFVHGETRRYLRPPPGQATLNVLEMSHAELKRDLAMAIRSVVKDGKPVERPGLTFRDHGTVRTTTLSVRLLPHSDHDGRLLLVSFQDVPGKLPARTAVAKRARAAPHRRMLEELERDLASTKESLEATIEEQQASNEELRSANEEMQSTNEELQSTNEELETSKEEMQSVNEELVTVNSELQSKIEQLAGMQNDMKNLLDNISIGTVFLDERLVIRRFTTEAAQIYRLVATDIGRPLTDIKTDIEGRDLIADAEAVIEKLVPLEREVRTRKGAWFLARLQPYRTLENQIRGVVMTFVPRTDVKQVQKALQDALELALGIVETVREPLVVLDRAFQVVSASREFYRRFQVTPEETVRRSLYEIGAGQWNIPALRELLESVLPRDEAIEGYEVETELPGLGRRTMTLSARRIIGPTQDTELILLAIQILPVPEEIS